MRKYSLLIASLCTVICAVTAQAAQIGTIMSIPMQIMEEERLSINAEASFITDRDLDTKSGTTNSIDQGTQIGIKAAYRLIESVNVYAKLGMADWSINKSTPMTIDYETSPYYGAGLSYTYITDTGIIIAGDMQYTMQPDVEISSINYQNIVATNIKGLDGEFTELQLSLLFGYEILDTAKIKIVPYTGFTYSQFKYEASSGSFTAGSTISTAAESLESDDVLGFVAGAGIDLGSALKVNFESRFGAETAFSTTFHYRF
jgi:outer membrane protein W